LISSIDSFCCLFDLGPVQKLGWHSNDGQLGNSPMEKCRSVGSSDVVWFQDWSVTTDSLTWQDPSH